VKRHEFDPATMLAACGGDETLLRKMIDSFQRTVPGYVAELRDAAAQRDEERLRRAAHKLRGLVSAFSPSLAVTVAALEEPAPVQPPDRALLQCAQVGESIAGLVAALAPMSPEDLERLPAIMATETASTAIVTTPNGRLNDS
jgi:HPt (histidine-containing phosphotransfer) domain-containing protein